MNKKPIVAIMYDFDKTLSPKDMQEYGFIDNLGIKANEFWEETAVVASEHEMDKILAYMYQMHNKAKEVNLNLTKELFNNLGKNILFFPGVEEWFTRVNKIGEYLGLHIEHYIISSGLKEIIEGTPICKHFKEIYACEYLYDEAGKAKWPKTVVNYTTKTQFLFRISKGALDPTDDITINKRIPAERRRIKFENMIYIGDGFTDIPCMSLVKEHGGKSIAVYPEGKAHLVQQLLSDDRVNFLCLADYSVNSDIDRTLHLILQELAIRHKLNTTSNSHKKP